MTLFYSSRMEIFHNQNVALIEDLEASRYYLFCILRFLGFWSCLLFRRKGFFESLFRSLAIRESCLLLFHIFVLFILFLIYLLYFLLPLLLFCLFFTFDVLQHFHYINYQNFSCTNINFNAYFYNFFIGLILSIIFSAILNHTQYPTNTSKYHQQSFQQLGQPAPCSSTTTSDQYSYPSKYENY